MNDELNNYLVLCDGFKEVYNNKDIWINNYLTKPTENRYKEILMFFWELYLKEEEIRRHVANEDWLALYYYVVSYSKALHKKYGIHGEHLLTLCGRKDYELIASYVDSLHNAIMHEDYRTVDYIGKVNIVFDYYEDLKKHDFSQVMKYADNCDLISSLCALIRLYRESLSKKDIK